MFHPLTRVAGQLIFCSPEQILHRAVVEQDEQKNIVRFFSLDDNQVESAHTLLFDGIISAGIQSIKQYKTTEEINRITTDYNYLDISGKLPEFEIIASNKPLLLDFGTNSIAEINRRIADYISILGIFSILEIIAASVYYPAVVMGHTAVLTPNFPVELLLWEGVDLVNKKITGNTRIRSIL